MAERTYVDSKNIGHAPLWKGEGPLAAHLDIELTERCNNACIHCCINKPAGDKRSRALELDTCAWKDILSQAAGLGVMTVRFTGGEPLLRKDFTELYLFARRLGLKVMLFTNARLITPQIAALLADIPPREDIEVSVYGMTRKSYEAVTGVAGSYAQFRSGVQCLLDRKVPFVVKGALLPANKDEMGEFAAWAAASTHMDAAPTYAMFFDLRGRRDSAVKNGRIKRLRISPEEGLKVLNEDPGRYLKEMSQFFANYSSTPGDKLFTCGIGPGCVDAYGFLQPCLSLRDPGLVFDVRKGGLKEALASCPQGLREMHATNPAYLRRCARCFLRGFCEQCPAKSWSEHGTLDTPVEYCCRVAHAQARFLGLVREPERAWEVSDGAARIWDLTRRAAAS